MFCIVIEMCGGGGVFGQDLIVALGCGVGPVFGIFFIAILRCGGCEVFGWSLIVTLAWGVGDVFREGFGWHWGARVAKCLVWRFL